MKQATLKAAGTAALGVAIAAVAAGSASAAPAPGGLGLPTSALTNPGLTGAATGAVAKVPGGDQVAQVAGTLNPGVASSLTPAPAQAEPAAPAPEAAPVATAPEGAAPQGAPEAAAPEVQAMPAAEMPAPAGEAAPAAASANRIGGLDSVPGGQGLAKTPVGGLVSTVSGLSPAGGAGAPSLPGLGG